MPWVKGQSGNPRGRALGTKPNSEVRALIRAAAPDAVKALISLLNSPKPEVIVRAAEALLNRAGIQGYDGRADDETAAPWGLRPVPPLSDQDRAAAREALQEQPHGQAETGTPTAV
jgi:HEAT repeat protein